METISELTEGTWFNVDSQEYKNSYKLIGECEPKVYAAECNGELIEDSVHKLRTKNLKLIE